MSWIKLADKKPEKYKRILLTVDDGYDLEVREAVYMEPNFSSPDQKFNPDGSIDSIPGTVLAWQPLPEPYKG